MRGSGEDRGQATVEFALILPLLVLTTAFILHVGLVIAAQTKIEHAAREGARAAAVEPNRANAVARSAAQAVLGDRPAEVSVRLESTVVEVEVRTEVSLAPLLGELGSRTISAEVVMRREDLLGGSHDP
ncbi:MAG: TadE/TadG family type IV pilus assembly protein [Acidimicrobiales bacterium]